MSLVSKGIINEITTGSLLGVMNNPLLVESEVGEEVRRHEDGMSQKREMEKQKTLMEEARHLIDFRINHLRLHRSNKPEFLQWVQEIMWKNFQRNPEQYLENLRSWQKNLPVGGEEPVLEEGQMSSEERDLTLMIEYMVFTQAKKFHDLLGKNLDEQKITDTMARVRTKLKTELEKGDVDGLQNTTEWKRGNTFFDVLG